MVCVREAEKMKDYVLSRLSDSGIYVTDEISRDHVVLNAHLASDVHLFLHSKSEGAEDFAHAMRVMAGRGELVSNIFYKDGKTFFVPLTRDQIGKYRQSMKLYDYNNLMKMVNLRKKEEEVLDMQGAKRLAYYQPDNRQEGGRLREGLINFAFQQARTDYSHIASDRRGRDLIFKHDDIDLKRRRISDHKQSLDYGLRFVPSRNGSKMLVLAPTPIYLRANSVTSQQQIKDFLQEFKGDILSWGGEAEILKIIAGESV